MTLLILFAKAAFLVAAIIAMTRLQGVRSFSKMSGFDFAVTVAFGSILAGAVTAPDKSAIPPLIALAALFVLQAMIAAARRRWPNVQNAVDNAPVLVMREREVLAEGLKRAGMTEADLWGKLREANAWRLEDVLAVVAEPTGDVSVLHGKGGFDDIDEELLRGVVRP